MSKNRTDESKDVRPVSQASVLAGFLAIIFLVFIVGVFLGPVISGGDLAENIINFGLLGLVKGLLLSLLFLFIVFTIVVFRQVQLMSRVLTVPISGGLKFAALGLLMFAVGIFILALLIL